MSTRIEDCIHCGACTRVCPFLGKYGIEASDTEAFSSLAYHCFLCDECRRVCPADISGRDISLMLRQELVAEGSSEYTDRKYSFVLREKRDYRFRNYRHASGKTALFPGCNFPSLFPRTNAELVKTFARDHGIGAVYDCCGKPIAELGLAQDETRIIGGIQERLASHGITEIVTMCPNCYYYLKDRLDIRVTCIYDKLSELGMDIRIPEGDIRLYQPCPDRGSDEWMDSIGRLTGVKPVVVRSAICCGLGGFGAANEPEIAEKLADRDTIPDGIVTFCASCAGQFARKGVARPRHILSLMMEIDESPQIRTSYINRAMLRFR